MSALERSASVCSEASGPSAVHLIATVRNHGFPVAVDVEGMDEPVEPHRVRAGESQLDDLSCGEDLAQFSVYLVVNSVMVRARIPPGIGSILGTFPPFC